MAITESPNLDIRIFTDFSSAEPRDPQSGRLLRHLTQLQLDSVLERYPHLKDVAPTLRDPNVAPEWRDPVMYFNGARGHLIEDAARHAALLRDPAPVRSAPTKPSTATRTPERTVGVAFHEAFHAAAALHNGVRVLGVTIVRDVRADGRTTMLLDRKECPVINAYISFAGEEGDKYGGYAMDAHTYESDRDIGGSLEWREAIRTKVRAELHLFSRGAVEFARQLMAKRTLTAFEVKSAYVRGQREARVKAEQHNSDDSAKSVTRTFRFDNPQDLADWNRQMGREPDAQPIMYRCGEIVQGSFK
jgi:hypothetical protein